MANPWVSFIQLIHFCDLTNAIMNKDCYRNNSLDRYITIIKKSLLHVSDSPSFYIRVFYVGKEVLKRELSGDDVRIAVFPASLAPPALKMSGFKRVPLPPPPPDLASSHISSISSLLGFLEGGVALSLSESGIYAKRFCQGRVFWRGPHTPDQIATKMERGVKPTMIFNRQSFRQGEQVI